MFVPRSYVKIEKKDVQVNSVKSILCNLSMILLPFLIFIIIYQFAGNIHRTEYIQLSIAILSEMPDSNKYELRAWAIEILGKYSRVDLPQSVKESLIKDVSLPKMDPNLNNKLIYDYFLYEINKETKNSVDRDIKK